MFVIHLRVIYTIVPLKGHIDVAQDTTQETLLIVSMLHLDAYIAIFYATLSLEYENILKRNYWVITYENICNS